MNLSSLAPFGIRPFFVKAPIQSQAVQEDDIAHAASDSILEEPIAKNDAGICEEKTNPFEHLTMFAKNNINPEIQRILKEVDRIYQMCDALSYKVQTILEHLQIDVLNDSDRTVWNIQWNSSFSMPLDELPLRHQQNQTKPTRNPDDFKIVRKPLRESYFSKFIKFFKRLHPMKVNTEA